MKISSIIGLALGYGFTGVVAPSPEAGNPGVFTSTETVVLNEGEEFRARQRKRYHNNRCEVRLQGDGNFLVKRLVSPNPWYQTYKVAWSSGPGDESNGNYKAKIHGRDGSLMVIHKKSNGEHVEVYTSNVGDPQAINDYDPPLKRDHKLVITEECVLKIYRDSKEVWTNNHFGGLGGEAGISDYLQQGEMMHVKQCYTCDGLQDCIWYPHTLLLQQDCNLVQFVGQDRADLEEHPTILWNSQSSRPDVKDCYLVEDEDKLRIYEGKLDKSLPQFADRPGEVIWEADVDFVNPCSGGYEVLLKKEGGLEPSC